MSPFLYLQTRRIKNAFRRSFKTPVRGFMSVLVIGYMLFTLSLIFTLKEPKVKEGVQPLDMHFPIALVTLAHLVLVLYTIPPPKYLYSIFSETDIANLYQAPLPPWRVFRFFFFHRTFAGYCLFFVIFAFYGYWTLRLSVPGIFAHAGSGTHLLWNAFYVATILPALSGLLFWRIVLDMRREFKLIPSSLFRVSMFVFLGSIAVTVVYYTMRAYAVGLGFQAGLVKSIESPPLSVLLAPFNVLAQLFLIHADPASASFWICITFWIGLATSGYYVLRSHHLLLYDYAYRLTEFRAQAATRVKSPAERLKQMKQGGKNVLRLPWFIRLMDPRRAGAIFWLDMVITWRSFGTAIRGLHGVLFLAVICGWAALQYYHVPVKTPAVWKVSGFVMVMASWPLSMVSTLGFCEILRRVEIQKPIPLSALKTVTMHILQWTAMTCSVTLVPFFTAFILLGSTGYPVLFVLVAGWSFMHCMISAFFVISLYNPDTSDPIQRMYASVFGFLLSIGASIPAAAVVVVSILLHTPLVIVLGLVILANLASAAALHYLSARKYANFVPTE
jgi:hypothetical protein